MSVPGQNQSINQSHHYTSTESPFGPQPWHQLPCGEREEVVQFCGGAQSHKRDSHGGQKVIRQVLVRQAVSRPWRLEMFKVSREN